MNRLNLTRKIYTSSVNWKIVPNDAKGTSSNNWLSRHVNDKYVKWAKIKNYRARSAFKLIEIDDKHHILKPGQTVIECGAAPGSWTQVCVERINSNGLNETKPKGRILAFDINHLETVPGAEVFVSTDLMRADTHEKIIKLLNGGSANLILSDMAPSMTGIKSLDCELSSQMVNSALNLSLRTLRVGGTLLVKHIEGGDGKKFENYLLNYFSIVKFVKPSASRKESSEVYFLAKKFKGMTNIK